MPFDPGVHDAAVGDVEDAFRVPLGGSALSEQLPEVSIQRRPAFLGSVIVLMFGLGISEPALMGQAMTASDTGTGQAAALLGAAQFLLGAVATVIAGIAAAVGPLP